MDLGKNVVIGTALHYGPAQLKVFLESFRRYNTKDDIALLVNRDNKLFEFFDKYNVTPVFFESWKYAGTHINNSRFIRYLEFLLDKIVDYDRVMLSDTRDVVFQDDPFKDLPFDCMYFFAEDHHVKIVDDQEYSAPWIKMVFGDEVYEQLKDLHIICAGTTIGSTGNIIKYLTMMTDVLHQLREKNPNVYQINIDQGIHNYIAHNTNRYYPDGTIKENGDIVGTVGHTSISYSDNIEYKDDHILVYGKKPAVVHQYDRTAQLTNFYQKIYG
jgi:hypothetical protein